MKTIQFIYSFINANQVLCNLDFTPECLLSADSLSTFAKSVLTPDEVDELVKISTCIQIEEGEDPRKILPQWFMECSGKLYFDNGQLA